MLIPESILIFIKISVAIAAGFFLLCILSLSKRPIVLNLWRFSIFAGSDSEEEPPASKESLKESELRADYLLREFLTDEQYWQLKRFGYLEIPSPSMPDRIYRIPRYQGQVKVYDDRGKSPIGYLCVQPKRFLPSGDLVLLHKLHIEANEDEYLRIANRWGSGGVPLRDNCFCRIR